MAVATTKLPTGSKSVIPDPDLAAALERELKPLAGKKLEAAQQAIRDVRASGVMGSFQQLLDRYRAAIKDAIAE